MWTILFLLVAGHALGDFALQNEWVAKNKVRNRFPIHAGVTIWPYVLLSHALQHGMIVFFITQSLGLGLAEVGAHAIIDFFKGEGRINFHVDQGLHIACKVLWLLVYILVFRN